MKKIISVILTLLIAVSCITAYGMLDVSATQSRTENFNKNFSLSGSGSDDIVSVAAAQLGKTGSQLGYSEQWCADFVSDCAILANQSSAIPASGYCPTLRQNILNAGGYYVDKNSAKKGDIVFYGNNGADHVEIVYAASNGNVSTYGGNSGSGSSLYSRSVRQHPTQSQSIAYIVRPKYSAINKPTDVHLDRSQVWYDIQDDIVLYPRANDVEYFWISVYKDGNQIISQRLDVNSELRFSANQWGYGEYYSWITAANSAGATDSEGISFSVVGSPTYNDIWTSKGFYDWDENEEIKINISPVCAKTLWLGIDFLDNDLHYVKRIITQQSDTTFTIPAKTLGIGYFSAYFTVINGSGSVDTKAVYFYVGQKQNVGEEFFAKIKNSSSNKYLTAVGNNVEGKDENCDKQQVWLFYRLSDGSYKIKNYYDYRSMDVENYADAGAGTNVQVYNDWDSTAQRFYIYQINGAYYIKPVCTDMVLDLSQTTNNLEVWGAGFNWSPQKFEIEKISQDKIGVHNYTDKIIKPTTTQKGYVEHICSVCGNSYTDKYCILGDTDNDGILSVNDATQMQMYLSFTNDNNGNLIINENDEYEFAIADFNKDNALTVSDVTAIQMAIVNAD